MSDDELKRRAKEYWDAAREQVKQGNCDFKGRKFPEDPSLKCFKEIGFKEEANFEGAVFEGVVYFNQAIFEKAAIFTGAIFELDASFRKAVFKNHALFNNKTTFKKSVDFVEATFGAHALFTDMSIHNGIFYDSIFQDVAEFGNARFWSATFHRVVFESYARFSGAHFESEALFPSATFMRSAIFLDCVFKGKADFRGARAVELVEFPKPVSPLYHPLLYLNLLLDKDKRVFLHTEQGETAYRFAKQSAINNGDSIAASDYHFAECRAAEAGKRFVEWLMSFVMRMFFGYGDKPLRVIGASIFAILVFAFFYFQMSCTSEHKTFLDALYTSAAAFTTLGDNDYHPNEYSRFLIVSEALIGIFFTSTFVVVMGRRYM